MKLDHSQKAMIREAGKWSSWAIKGNIKLRTKIWCFEVLREDGQKDVFAYQITQTDKDTKQEIEQLERESVQEMIDFVEGTKRDPNGKWYSRIVSIKRAPFAYAKHRL